MNSSRRAFLGRSATLLASRHVFRLSGPGDFSPEFNVRDRGATGNGAAPDTRCIQAAIDAAGAVKGTVYFPPGKYLSGTLHLRSYVTIQLDADATLVASANDKDFDPRERLPYDAFADEETTDFRFALLQGRGLSRVSVIGAGRIDGHRRSRGGPKLIALKECRDVHIRDVTLVDAPNYNISLLGCDRVVIVGLTILNGYADGIDPDCCRNVRISHCRIESRDDAVAIKASFALGARRATEDVEVTACDLSTMHNGLKLGTESTGDFRRVVFSNCTIAGRRHPWKGHLSCGVALETVDGGHLEDVRVSDVRMADVRTPIFVRLGARGWAPPGVPASMLTNVSISNVVASGAIMASSITGIPRQPVSGISLANVRAVVTGRSTGYRAPEDVPELPHTYPDAYMFRDLPAYGFYCRHVRGLVLGGIDVGIERPDARSAVMLDDVRNASLQAIRAKSPAGAEPLIHLRSVRGCVVRGVEPQEGTRTFVRLSGADTTGIRLVGNDLSRVDRVAMMDTEVSPSALRVESTEALSRARGV